jgi:hypothetical protein
MSSLADKVVALHQAFDMAGLPHAFGGALALAWCTRQPRATSDIDVNVFVPTASVNAVLHSLPAEVTTTRDDARQLRRDGQARLYWDDTPIDVFLNTTGFHEAVTSRLKIEPFAGAMIPFLGCSDLAVFKAFFDRRRDWADIEDMLVVGSLDVDHVVSVLAENLGPGDERIAKLRSLQAEIG